MFSIQFQSYISWTFLIGYGDMLSFQLLKSDFNIETTRVRYYRLGYIHFSLN